MGSTLKWLVVLFILFLCAFTFFALIGVLVSEEPPLAGGEVEDRGDFIVVYGDAGAYEKYEEMAKLGLFEVVANVSNQMLALPYDVRIELSSCGEVNAFYVPYQKTMLICYELFDSLINTFAQSNDDPRTVARMTVHTMLFITLHEMGHAVIDVYQLPVVGREEDAADQFGAFWLTRIDKELAAEVLLDTAQWFYLESETPDEMVFWDEHSLNAQRFYNIVCWTYGSDPQAFRDLEEILPQERRERCPEEFDTLDRSWRQLLGPALSEWARS